MVILVKSGGKIREFKKIFKNKLVSERGLWNSKCFVIIIKGKDSYNLRYTVLHGILREFSQLNN